MTDRTLPWRYSQYEMGDEFMCNGTRFRVASNIREEKTIMAFPVQYRAARDHNPKVGKALPFHYRTGG